MRGCEAQRERSLTPVFHSGSGREKQPRFDWRSIWGTCVDGGRAKVVPGGITDELSVAVNRRQDQGQRW